MEAALGSKELPRETSSELTAQLAAELAGCIVAEGDGASQHDSRTSSRASEASLREVLRRKSTPCERARQWRRGNCRRKLRGI